MKTRAVVGMDWHALQAEGFLYKMCLILHFYVRFVDYNMGTILIKHENAWFI